MTGMVRWKLCFALLLSLIFYNDGKGTWQIVKTTGSEPYVSPVCTNETLHNITFIRCEVRTERTWGAPCSLVYRYGQDFENGYDSRFRLTTENGTVFLRLTSLEPADSGNYTCQCSSPTGNFELYLSITVEGVEIASSSTAVSFPHVVIGVIIILLIITGVILGLIYRKICHGGQPETTHPNTEPGDIEPYSTFLRRENELQESDSDYSCLGMPIISPAM